MICYDMIYDMLAGAACSGQPERLAPAAGAAPLRLAAPGPEQAAPVGCPARALLPRLHVCMIAVLPSSHLHV